MLGALNLLVYFALVWVTINYIKYYYSLNVVGVFFGCLIGFCYYVIPPMFVGFISGSIGDVGILFEPYNLWVDHAVTLHIFIGWLALLFIPEVLGGNLKQNIYRIKFSQEANLYVHKQLYLTVFVYAATLVYSALSRGLFEEGAHWHNSGSEIFESNFALSMLLNFANAFRISIIGKLIYLTKLGVIAKKFCVVMFFCIAFFDIIMTSNRIVLLYVIVGLLIIYDEYAARIITTFLVLSPVAAFLSTIWAWYRGFDGTSVAIESGFFNKISMVVQNYISSGSSSFLQEIGSIFESANIQVYSFIVKMAGKEFDYLLGETFLLRPLTIFFPSSIWENKPTAFGPIMGVLVNGADGLSLNSTLFGEATANFGLFWPVFLIIALILISKLCNFITKYSPSFPYTAMLIGFALWRFEMNFAVVVILSEIFIILLLAITKNRGRNE